jgi:hypothetical protein
VVVEAEAAILRTQVLLAALVLLLLLIMVQQQLMQFNHLQQVQHGYARLASH